MVLHVTAQRELGAAQCETMSYPRCILAIGQELRKETKEREHIIHMYTMRRAMLGE